MCLVKGKKTRYTAEELAMLANEYVQIRGPVIGGKLEQKEKFDKSKVKCFSCQEKGHYSYECKNRDPAKEGRLGISSTPGYKGYDRMSTKGQVNGQNIDW